jgi:hypothetical protein
LRFAVIVLPTGTLICGLVDYSEAPLEGRHAILKRGPPLLGGNARQICSNQFV